MANKVRKPRDYSGGKLPPSITNYKEMRKINERINARMEEVTERWTCAKCGCNSFLSMEYGCDKCQPFKPNNKLTGRVYAE